MSNVRFIAETAFSHEGDPDYLSELVDLLLDSDACILKFQVLLQPEYSSDHPMASSCYGLMLSKSDWLAIFKKVRSQGKKILILPVDLDALKWAMSENLADIIEVHSVNLFRKDFYECIQASHDGVEIVLSISGYESESIDFIVSKYKSINHIKISLMFGFQAFPTDPKKIGLARISMLQRKHQVDVGYADHTSWDFDSSSLCAAATALGASMIEKHVVLEPGRERIDFNSAVDVGTLNRLIAESRIVSDALGSSSEYALDEVETKYGERRLKLICEFPLSSGERIMPPKATYRWTTYQSQAGEIDAFRLFGQPSDQNVRKGEVIA